MSEVFISRDEDATASLWLGRNYWLRARQSIPQGESEEKSMKRSFKQKRLA